jgi:hypothetical protein
MTRHMTLFSESLMLDDDPAIQAEQLAWINKALDEHLEDEDGTKLVNALQECGVPVAMGADLQHWPDFDWTTVTGIEKPYVLLHSMHGCNLENVAAVVQGFLRKFYPNNSFGLQWASTCSSPRSGEFGGGAMFITAENVRWMSTHSALQRFEGESR